MIHGLLPLRKPPGISSHRAIERVRRVFTGHKVGHFGTLDPMAEGLLLVGIGRGTRFFKFYQNRHKVYEGEIRFGFATDTYDREGAPVGEPQAVDLNEVDLESMLSSFRGDIVQVPPVYSAKKLNGRPMYDYARKGVAVTPKPVQVTIYSLTGKVVAPDRLAFSAETGSGTYIRSLAHDLGGKLGCGAHLDSLVRVAVGEFLLEESVTVESLDARKKGDTSGICVVPLEEMLPELPKVVVSPQGRKGVLNGNLLEPRDVLRLMSAMPSPWYRVFDADGRLIAMATPAEKSGTFAPQMVFADDRR